MWQGSFPVPAGSYEYKAALNDSWDENYGLHAQLNGANIPLNLASGASVKFYYDHKSHWITDNERRSSRWLPAASSPSSAVRATGNPTVSAPGSRTPMATAPTRSRPPRCRRVPTSPRSRSTRPGTRTTAQGGVPGGGNILFTVPADNLKVTFSYDSVSHVLSITVAVDHGAPGGPGALSHFDLARKDCLGTARNTTSKVWYTVAGGVLSDVYYPTVDNTNVETLQYIVTDGSTFTDLQTRDMTYTVPRSTTPPAWPAVSPRRRRAASTRSRPTTSPTRAGTAC